MSTTEDSEKSHEPSRRKLDEARRKGEIPRSVDMTTAAGYAGMVLVATAFGAGSLQAIGGGLADLLRSATSMPSKAFEPSPLVFGLLSALAPLFLLPMLFCLLSLTAQQGLVFTGSKLAPKLSRVSILSNAKNKFGRAGLFEFCKSAVKLSFYSVALFIYLWRSLPEIVGLVTLDPALATALALRLTLRFCWLVLSVAIVIGLIDLFWQRAEHLRKNRMSRKEMMDEHKDSEGDPHMKGQRRQRGMEIASNRMLADVPDASVVVVNPTHYAVALRWSRNSPGAPVCVAKGVDGIALRIRDTAEASGVPIHSDPPTARALHATVEIGDEIAPEHYAPVAVAIRFAEEMRRKARAR